MIQTICPVTAAASVGSMIMASYTSSASGEAAFSSALAASTYAGSASLGAPQIPGSPSSVPAAFSSYIAQLPSATTALSQFNQVYQLLVLPIMLELVLAVFP